MKFRHCVDRDCLRFALFYQGVDARRDKPAAPAASRECVHSHDAVLDRTGQNARNAVIDEWRSING
jgi:hypothetical protein